jgi:hypothetical protein
MEFHTRYIKIQGRIYIYIYIMLAETHKYTHTYIILSLKIIYSVTVLTASNNTDPISFNRLTHGKRAGKDAFSLS